MSGRPSYRHYPDDWDMGVAELTLEQEAAYLKIVGRIYRRGGPIPDNDRWLASLARVSVRKWRLLKKALVAHGKISISGGLISNARAQRELVKNEAIGDRSSAQGAKSTQPRINGEAAAGDDLAKTSVKTGQKRAVNGVKHEDQTLQLFDNIENPPASRAGDSLLYQKDTETPDGVSSTPSACAPSDLKSRIFGECLDWLSGQTDKPKAKLRPLVGRWCRDYGDGRVLEIMVYAARDGPVEPIGWIQAKLGGSNGTGHGEDHSRGSPGAARAAAILGRGAVGRASRRRALG